MVVADGFFDDRRWTRIETPLSTVGDILTCPHAKVNEEYLDLKITQRISTFGRSVCQRRIRKQWEGMKRLVLPFKGRGEFLHA